MAVASFTALRSCSPAESREVKVVGDHQRHAPLGMGRESGEQQGPDGEQVRTAKAHRALQRGLIEKSLGWCELIATRRVSASTGGSNCFEGRKAAHDFQITQANGIFRTSIARRKPVSAENEKDFAALGLITRAHVDFERRICAASISQDERVLDQLRLDKMWEFAEFYYSFVAMGLDGPEDIDILAELHNDRLTHLLRDENALERRGLRKDRLLDAIFTSDTLPRLRQFWRDRPGALDQSNLGRFLVTQMSAEKARQIVKAGEAAGFLSVTDHPFGAKIIISNGVMEQALGDSLRDMRLAIAKL
jgi:hypothetical protein